MRRILIIRHQMEKEKIMLEQEKLSLENIMLKEQVHKLNLYLPKKKIPIMDYIYIWVKK